jgi:hypothetical protein
MEHGTWIAVLCGLAERINDSVLNDERSCNGRIRAAPELSRPINPGVEVANVHAADRNHGGRSLGDGSIACLTHPSLRMLTFPADVALRHAMISSQWALTDTETLPRLLLGSVAAEVHQDVSCDGWTHSARRGGA